MNMPRGKKFFSLNGQYEIATTTTAEEMAQDGGCLLEASLAALQAVIEGLSDKDGQMVANPGDGVKILYGVQYQMEMARSLFAGIEARRVRS